MFYTFLILIAAATFILGYRLGNITEFRVNLKSRKADSETLRLKKEYENFLNYDGDEQP